MMRTTHSSGDLVIVSTACTSGGGSDQPGSREECDTAAHADQRVAGDDTATGGNLLVPNRALVDEFPARHDA